MNNKNGDDGTANTITTKAELLKRLREHKNPCVQAHLKPDGPIALQVRKDVAIENDQRIAYLRYSLRGAHDVVELQHSFARLHGYTAARFSKER